MSGYANLVPEYLAYEQGRTTSSGAPVYRPSTIASIGSRLRSVLRANQGDILHVLRDPDEINLGGGAQKTLSMRGATVRIFSEWVQNREDTIPIYLLREYDEDGVLLHEGRISWLPADDSRVHA